MGVLVGQPLRILLAPADGIGSADQRIGASACARDRPIGGCAERRRAATIAGAAAEQRQAGAVARVLPAHWFGQLLARDGEAPADGAAAGMARGARHCSPAQTTAAAPAATNAAVAASTSVALLHFAVHPQDVLESEGSGEKSAQDDDGREQGGQGAADEQHGRHNHEQGD